MYFETEGKKPSIYFGPGCWYTLHMMGARAVDKSKKKAFLELVNLYKNDLFCNECQKHFIEFCILDPPEKYVDKEEGLFLWSWRCHNNANSLTGKEIVTYFDAKNLYYGFNQCNKDCSSTVVEKQENPLKIFPAF